MRIAIVSARELDRDLANCAVDERSEGQYSKVLNAYEDALKIVSTKVTALAEMTGGTKVRAG